MDDIDFIDCGSLRGCVWKDRNEKEFGGVGNKSDSIRRGMLYSGNDSHSKGKTVCSVLFGSGIKRKNKLGGIGTANRKKIGRNSKINLLKMSKNPPIPAYIGGLQKVRVVNPHRKVEKEEFSPFFQKNCIFLKKGVDKRV